MRENNQIMEFAPILMAIFTAIIAIISAYITTKFQLWSEKSKKENEKWVEYKDSRYKAVLGLMLCLLDFEKQKPKLQKFNRADINTIDDLLDELDAEWKNMILYANDDVIKAMGEFMKDQDLDKFWKTSIEMRKDLYGIRTKLGTSTLSRYIHHENA